MAAKSVYICSAHSYTRQIYSGQLETRALCLCIDDDGFVYFSCSCTTWQNFPANERDRICPHLNQAPRYSKEDVRKLLGLSPGYQFETDLDLLPDLSRFRRIEVAD